MKLYFAPGACSLAPNIVVHEAGLAPRVALVKADIRTKKLADGSDYLAINPRGQVPVLELDDGTRLTEGPAIMQYLADHAAGSGLAPANGTLARYQLQGWLNFVSSELHKAWSPLWNKALDPAVHEWARGRIDQRLGDLESVLTEHPFLMGERFTVADAYLFTIVNWGQHTGIDLARWPWIAAYHARIKARPAVVAAVAAERALK